MRRVFGGEVHVPSLQKGPNNRFSWLLGAAETSQWVTDGRRESIKKDNWTKIAVAVRCIIKKIISESLIKPYDSTQRKPLQENIHYSIYK